MGSDIEADSETVPLARARAAGVEGLIPRYPKRRARPVSGNLCELIRHARKELHYGSTRTQLWLWRRHRLRLSQSTILRGVPIGVQKTSP